MKYEVRRNEEKRFFGSSDFRPRTSAMRQSQLFAKTLKEDPGEAEVISHKLLLRGDFISQLSSGIYSFLPLGYRVHKKIENIIRDEMIKIGAQELFLPALQPKSLWEETGRWKTIDPPLFKLEDRHKKELALGSTHEEVITDLARKRVRSWRDLPLSLFQIQNKFRNEMRATGGLLRVREFMMKDLYSFHASEKDLLKYYEEVKKAYFRIFKRCELSVVCVQADPGTIGGKLSHEFITLAETGEDKVLVCQKCSFGVKEELAEKETICPKCKEFLEEKKCIESAHAFYLGTEYSKKMGANFVDKDGKAKPAIMGCYGIGIGRLMATIVEVRHDKNGIIWPKEVAPFQIHIIPIGNTRKVEKASEKLYKDLSASAPQKRSYGGSTVAFGVGGQTNDLEVLYDDRIDKTAGEKFATSDLIGIPIRVVLSEKTLKKGSLEVKKRWENKIKLIKINSIKSYFGARMRGAERTRPGGLVHLH